MTFKLLVCGGRDYADRQSVYRELDRWHSEHPDLTIVCGGANGADALAYDWAVYREVRKVVERADWERYGRRAGPIRNQKMLDLHRPDAVLAFPGGSGTRNMIGLAEKAGVVVHRPP